MAANDSKEKIKMLRGVRQVREFRPDPVPDDVLNDILEVARWTGSGMNSQPWRLVVVRDRAALEALAATGTNPGHLAKAPLGIVIAMQGDNPEMRSYDEARLTERIVLAAAAHGLGAGIWWLRPQGREAAHNLLGIPDDLTVRTSIGIGYIDEQARKARKPNPEARKPLSELVHYEHY